MIFKPELGSTRSDFFPLLGNHYPPDVSVDFNNFSWSIQESRNAYASWQVPCSYYGVVPGSACQTATVALVGGVEGTHDRR